MLKTRPDRYGTFGVSIHWLSAITVLPLPAQPTNVALGSLAAICGWRLKTALGSTWAIQAQQAYWPRWVGS
jgi:hypothetical protein